MCYLLFIFSLPFALLCKNLVVFTIVGVGGFVVVVTCRCGSNLKST